MPNRRAASFFGIFGGIHLMKLLKDSVPRLILVPFAQDRLYVFVQLIELRLLFSGVPQPSHSASLFLISTASSPARAPALFDATRRNPRFTISEDRTASSSRASIWSIASRRLSEKRPRKPDRRWASAFHFSAFLFAAFRRGANSSLVSSWTTDGRLAADNRASMSCSICFLTVASRALTRAR